MRCPAPSQLECACCCAALLMNNTAPCPCFAQPLEDLVCTSPHIQFAGELLAHLCGACNQGAPAN